MVPTLMIVVMLSRKWWPDDVSWTGNQLCQLHCTMLLITWVYLVLLSHGLGHRLTALRFLSWAKAITKPWSKAWLGLAYLGLAWLGSQLWARPCTSLRQTGQISGKISKMLDTESRQVWLVLPWLSLAQGPELELISIWSQWCTILSTYDDYSTYIIYLITKPCKVVPWWLLTSLIRLSLLITQHQQYPHSKVSSYSQPLPQKVLPSLIVSSHTPLSSSTTISTLPPAIRTFGSSLLSSHAPSSSSTTTRTLSCSLAHPC